MADKLCNKSPVTPNQNQSNKSRRIECPANESRETRPKQPVSDRWLRSSDYKIDPYFKKSTSTVPSDEEPTFLDLRPQTLDPSSTQTIEIESSSGPSSVPQSSETLDVSPSDLHSQMNTSKRRITTRRKRNTEDVHEINEPSDRAVEEANTEKVTSVSDDNDSDSPRESSAGSGTQASVGKDSRRKTPPKELSASALGLNHEALCRNLITHLKLPRPAKCEAYVVYDEMSRLCKVGSSNRKHGRVSDMNKKQTSSKASKPPSKPPCLCINLDEDGVKGSGTMKYGKSIESIAHRALKAKHLPLEKDDACIHDKSEHTLKKEYFYVSHKEGVDTVGWITKLFKYVYEAARLDIDDVSFQAVIDVITAAKSEYCDYNNIDAMNRFWALKVEKAMLAEQAKCEEQQNKYFTYCTRRKMCPPPKAQYPGTKTNEIKLLELTAFHNRCGFILIEEKYWRSWYVVWGVTHMYQFLKACTLAYAPSVFAFMILSIFRIYNFVIESNSTKSDNDNEMIDGTSS